MIKKLRRRFIIVNMSILTSVLICVLTGIFAFMYSSEVTISYELMESILNERDVDIREPDKKIVESPVESAQELSFSAEQAAVMMSFQLQNIDDNGDNKQYFYEQYPKPDDGHGQFPEEPDFPQDPFPVEPDRPWDYPDYPEDSSSSQPEDSRSDDSSSSVKEDDSSSSSAPEKPESSQDESRPEEPVYPQNENSQREAPVPDAPPEPIPETQSPATEKTAETTAPITSEQNETHTSLSTAPVTQSKTADPPPEKEFPDPYRGNVKRAFVMVQYNQNEDIDRIIYQYFEDADEEQIKEAARTIINQKNDRGKLTIGDYKLRYMKKDNPAMMNGGGRILFLDRTLEISTINRMLFIFIIIGSVGTVIIFGISVVLANWTIKPVDKAWQQQKQFVADASHELKTPLTVISANTDVILSNSDDTVKSQSKWLNYIKEETKRMTKLVNSLLYIAKYDSNEIKYQNSQIDLSNLLSSICLQYEALVFEKGKTLETDIGEGVFINADEDKIKQLINILLDNAVKYSTDNGQIKVFLSKDPKNGKAKIEVSNSSFYIAPEKLEKLFDRFYRLDDSRNRKTGGSGLGLNIAKSIVEAYGGEIKAGHENFITTFTVML